MKDEVASHWACYGWPLLFNKNKGPRLNLASEETFVPGRNRFGLMSGNCFLSQ